jgi:molybdate transport system ATP-binding protein
LADGVSEIEVSGARLIIVGRVSGPVALVIDPDAVVLSLTRPESSARNALHGGVASVVPDGAGVRVNVASMPPIVARITRQSAVELGIAPGVSVYATFKASEVRVH